MVTTGNLRFFMTTGRRFRAGGFGEIGRKAGRGDAPRFFLKLVDMVRKLIYNRAYQWKGVLYMAQTNINIRMDAELKKQFEAFCADVGMSMTTAFNIFAKKAVRENRIPFEVGGDIPNEETRRAIERAQKGIGLSKGFSSVQELMEDLNADD